MFEGKNILVTGGTGSFGNAFIPHLLANHSPAKIIVYSRDELKQYELGRRITDSRVRYFLGDIRDVDRLNHAFRGVDVVVHAAALKQVPALEYNPTEGIQTNVLGAMNIIQAAVGQGVEQVLALSTDKACSPSTLYGGTKFLMEKLFVAANAFTGDQVRFSVTRYGNVAGSRGSVIPTFQDQLSNDQPLTLTDAQMSRFWMRLDQAVELVTDALHYMRGGEIFIPKLPSFFVRDLAAAMAPDGKTQLIGIRGEEKLSESLISVDETRHVVDEGWCYRIVQGVNAGVGEAYTSANNEEWLSVEDLKAELEKV